MAARPLANAHGPVKVKAGQSCVRSAAGQGWGEEYQTENTHLLSSPECETAAAPAATPAAVAPAPLLLPLLLTPSCESVCAVALPACKPSTPSHFCPSRAVGLALAVLAPPLPFFSDPEPCLCCGGSGAGVALGVERAFASLAAGGFRMGVLSMALARCCSKYVRAGRAEERVTQWYCRMLKKRFTSKSCIHLCICSLFCGKMRLKAPRRANSSSISSSTLTSSSVSSSSAFFLPCHDMTLCVSQPWQTCTLQLRRPQRLEV